ncbi:hypothetical protein V4C53_43150 [Paraburkholderia azotifigens]|uniref:hypothetical protein n=1 Tax=Paraburkholderia azotifigens TaxID=2057004 RepID=UPI00317781A9
MNALRTALHGQDTTITESLYVAFELGGKSWKLSLVDGVCADRLHGGRWRYGRSLHGDFKGQRPKGAVI